MLHTHIKVGLVGLFSRIEPVANIFSLVAYADANQQTSAATLNYAGAFTPQGGFHCFQAAPKLSFQALFLGIFSACKAQGNQLYDFWGSWAAQFAFASSTHSRPMLCGFLFALGCEAHFEPSFLGMSEISSGKPAVSPGSKVISAGSFGAQKKDHGAFGIARRLSVRRLLDYVDIKILSAIPTYGCVKYAIKSFYSRISDVSGPSAADRLSGYSDIGFPGTSRSYAVNQHFNLNIISAI